LAELLGFHLSKTLSSFCLKEGRKHEATFRIIRIENI
jgi:hypothetical protein